MCDSLLEHKATFDILEGHSLLRKNWDAGKYSESELDLSNSALRVAYGHSGLGNHLYGSRHLIEELCEEELDLWQDVMYSPNKLVVAGFGVNDHDEFVNLVDT